MACAEIEQILQTESGRIGPTIHRKTLHSSPWLKLVKQAAWPDEMGHTISVLTYERSLPSTTFTWEDIGESDGEAGGTCLPPTVQIDFGSTLRTYNLQHGAIESPWLCVNDLRHPVYRREQLSNIVQVLSENVKEVWLNRYRDEYTRLSEHKVIARDGLPEGTSSFPLQVPTSRLTQGILNYLRMRLIRDGGDQNPLDLENGAPVFGLITGPESSDLIIREEENRWDIRHSSRVNELLAPMGVERPYRGFFHLIDILPPRWDFVEGAWVRRYPYSSSAASLGNKWDISAEYQAAAYEDSFIFHMDVFESLVPKPITNLGSGITFNPVNYRGVFRWVNEYDKDCNPDKTMGYFRGIYSSGSKPIHPQLGYVIRHLRCDSELTLLACS